MSWDLVWLKVCKLRRIFLWTGDAKWFLVVFIKVTGVASSLGLWNEGCIQLYGVEGEVTTTLAQHTCTHLCILERILSIIRAVWWARLQLICLRTDWPGLIKEQIIRHYVCGHFDNGERAEKKGGAALTSFLTHIHMDTRKSYTALQQHTHMYTTHTYTYNWATKPAWLLHHLSTSEWNLPVTCN